MSRTSVLVFLLAVWLPAAGAVEEKPKQEEKAKAPLLTYRDDKLSLSADKTPLREIVDELHRQSGAEVRGDIPRDAPITAKFENVPLSQALERFLGKSNFTLGYTEAGRLVSVTLLGGPLPPPEKVATADTASKAETGEIPTAAKIEQYRRYEESRRYHQTVWNFLFAEKEYPVRGKLAEALGKKSITMKDLAFAAAREPDPVVRGRALRASVDLVRSDAEVQQAFLESIRGLDDEALAHLARQFAQTNAEEFVSRVGRASQSRELRSRVSPILQHLGEMGPEK
jgi:hypothetical protein